MEEKKFYVPKDVRHVVFSDQLSMSSLLKLIHKGEIPSIRMGARIYVPAGWVNKQLEIAETGIVK